MDPRGSPYRPGAGRPPPVLVGRETELQDFDIAIQRFELGTGDRSRLLYGLRGVGKTVLLRKFVGIAEARDWTCRSVAAAAYLDFKVELADFARAALARLSARERLTGLLRRGLSVLKSFQLRYQLPEGPEIVAGVEPSLGEADFGNLKQNLGDLLVAVGRAAEERKTGVLFTVDEFQFLPREEMEALIVALHRVGQDELPVMVVGAGLPSILGKVGDARSYAERLFVFRRINSLGRDEARAVLEKPAADRGVHWSAAALDRAVEDTRGHPRFLQTLGEHCWKVAPGPSEITAADVEAALPSATAALDDGFFQVRVDRATPAGRRYLQAMASLGPGPHPSAAVAERLGRRPNQLSPQRDALIRLGLCYSPRHGEIAFTVPLFDRFVLRTMGPPSDP